MDNIESIIWDTITKSAKTKFDNDQFEDHFIGTKKEYADSVLFYIINGFGTGLSKSDLLDKVLDKMNKYGCNCTKSEVKVFLKDTPSRAQILFAFFVVIMI